ncbi:MAG: GNAT family N-acetyltransferase [Phycisphaerae bacterium]|nr:GNAT family N-acetyltransferase [Phycisphaerae bacterium]
MHIDLIEEKHLHDLTDLLNRNCDLEGDRFTPALVRRRLWDYPFNLSQARLGAFDDGRLVGTVIGGLTQSQGTLRVFAVEESHRRRGLASRMLGQLEEVLRRRGASEILALYGAPGYFMPGLDPRYTAALCLLQRQGYERTNVVVNMAVPLNGRQSFEALARSSERRIRRHGAHVRRAEPTDRSSLKAWVSQHFPGGWSLEADLAFDETPIPIWVAIRNARLVGFALYDADLFTGGFGPTGVAEEARGLGVGGALMLRTLADMQARGYGECEIAWVGPVGFYAHTCGARINRTLWQMSKKLR